jgi:tetratricopeptide (TPR) repeat protein
MFCYQCKEKRETPETESIPRIIHVSKNEVTLCWDSPEKYEGIIYYKNVDKVRGRPTSGKDLHESSHHTVVIGDLSPSTLYSYWIKDTKTKYTFRTEPESNSPLSFLITGDDSLANETSLISSESCGFILSVKERKVNNHKTANSFVPVFFTDGKNSELNEDTVEQASWFLDWGDLRLVIINKKTAVGSFLNTYGNHTLGIILNSGIVSDNPDELKKSDFHHNVITQNKYNATNPVVFVGIVNYPEASFVSDGINYFSIPLKKSGNEGLQASEPIIVSIDGLEASAYFPAVDKEIILNIPPVHSRRTCFECERLAKKKQYENSISAYEQFIKIYRKQYQIDDAYFAIAKILDENLFRFTEAKTWYHALIDSFPDAASISKAKQRLRYFSKYGDCNSEPLEKFEAIKSRYAETGDNMLKQQKQKIVLTPKQKEILDEAVELIKNFGGCKVVPLITSWIADQYQQADGKKAAGYYSVLLEKYPEFSASNEIQFKLGETYSLMGENVKAKQALLEARDKLPQLSEKIDAQLTKVTIKIRREILAYLAWALSVIILLASILLKPTGVSIPRIKIMLFVIAGFLYSFLMFFIAIREEISENFNGSYKEFFFFAGIFILFTALSLIVARTTTIKLYKSKLLRAKIVGGIAGVLLFISAFYLTIYYIYEQYLSYLTL